MSTVYLGKLSGMSYGKLMQGSLLLGAGISGLAAGLIAIKQHGLKSFSRSVQFVYVMLIICNVCAVVRSLSFQRQDLLTLIGNPIGLWSYTLPLLVVVGGRMSSWQLLHIAIRMHCLIGIVIFSGSAIIEPRWALEFASSPKGMFYAAGFLLFLWRYEGRATRAFAVVSLLVAALGNLLITLSRTNLIWCVLNYTFLWIILCLAEPDIFKNKIKLSFGLVLVSVFISSSLWLFLSPFPSVQNGMNEFRDKLYTDSRTFLVEEYCSDVHGLDMIIGRGALGTYWSEYFSYLDSIGQRADDANRNSCEIGYLHINLKGGMLMLTLFLLITVPAGFLGLFASRNVLVRGCGGTVLVTLLLMFLAWVPLSSANFALFWLCVGACLSSPLRNASDGDVRLCFGDDMRLKTTY